MKTNSFREDIKQQLKNLTKENLTVYLYETDGSFYGYIITQNDNILYFEDGLGELRFALCYKPSKSTGSSCEAIAQYTTLDSKAIKALEADGLQFARELKATFYKDSKAFLDKSYMFDSMVKLVC